MLPVESWNAQLSLLTGFAAASIMIDGKVGVLRTLPPAPEHEVRALRRTARALGIDWPNSMGHPEFIRSLDPSRPADAAMVVACTRLLRGAGYAAFDGQLPEQPEHAALASPYAHVTAPLRRLVDRYGLEICAALCAGQEVPAWVLDGHGRAAGPDARLGAPVARLRERGGQPRRGADPARRGWGSSFEGVVLEVEHDDEREGTVMVREPAVEAPVRLARRRSRWVRTSPSPWPRPTRRPARCASYRGPEARQAGPRARPDARKVLPTPGSRLDVDRSRRAARRCVARWRVRGRSRAAPPPPGWWSGRTR